MMGKRCKYNRYIRVLSRKVLLGGKRLTVQ